jgi:hypothetical protein
MTRRATVPALGLLFLACQPGNMISPPIEQSPDTNHPPEAKIGAPAIAPEGSRIPFSTDGTFDPDSGVLTFAWDFGDGVSLVTRDRGSDHVYRNNGAYVASLVVTDPQGAADTAVTRITIANVAPQITLLRIPDNPVVAGTLVEIEIQYADPGLDDTVQGMLWINRPGYGQGTGLRGPGVFQNRFTDPDQYTVSVSLQDNDGAMTYQQADHPIIVIPAGTTSGPIASTTARMAPPPRSKGH